MKARRCHGFACHYRRPRVRDLKAVAKTLVANGISAVPVVAIDGRVVGFISEGDLMRRAVSGGVRNCTRKTQGHLEPRLSN